VTAPTAIGAFITSTSPYVTVNGSGLPAALVGALQSMRVELGLRQVSRAELTFLDDHFALLTQYASLFDMGVAVSIALGRSSGSTTTVFSGVVTGIQVDQQAVGDGGPPYVTLVASDKLHDLAFGQKATTLEDASITTILNDLVSPLGLSLSISGLPDVTAEHVLVGESPLRHLDRLAELYGFDWWVQDGTFHAAAPDAGAEVQVDMAADVQQLSFETRDTGPGTATVTGWDVANKTVWTGTAVSTTVRPQANLAFPSARDGEIDSGRPLAVRATRLSSEQDAKAQAQAASDAARRDRTELRLQLHGPNPSLQPATSVVLKNAGPMNGSYPVSAVTHLWDSAGARTRVVAGPRRPRGLAAALGSGGAGLPFGGAAGLLLVGLVTDLNDPKSWGRIKVKLPTLGGLVQTGWARVLLPSGGASTGLVVPHQVGDEVVVGFEEGDLERPVVLGAVHGGSDKPPAATKADGGQAQVAGLTSRANHVLVVDDSEDAAKKGLRFDHSDAHKLHVTAEGISLTAEKSKPIKLVAGQSSIELDGQGNVTIKGMKVSIEAQTDLELKGTQLKGQAQATMSLQAQGTAELKANGMVTVESSGQTAVKGTIVQIN
jgi:uncharacterized protein involved in type VI secretion and phage assembly